MTRLSDNFFRTLAFHTAIFGLSALVRPISQLILVRLHTNTNFLTVEEYAAWTLLQIVLNIGVVFLNMGIATAFFRFYLLAKNKAEKRKVVGRTFRLTLTIAVTGGVILFLFADILSTLLIGSSEFGTPVRYIAIAVAGNTLTIVPLALLRAEGRMWNYLFFNVLKFFLIIGLNLWFLVFKGLRLDGVTLAFLISNVVLAVIYVPFLFGGMEREAWHTGWKQVLRYGIPLIALDMILYTLNGISQITLNLLGVKQDVAIYGFALRIAMIAQVAVVMPFNVAFSPILFKAKKENDDPRPLYAKTMEYIWIISLGMCLAVTALAPELAKILGKNPLYYNAVPYVGWIAFSAAFYGIFFVFSSGASLKDKTWAFPIILLFAGAIEVAAGFLFIPLMGIGGAAKALLAGYIFLSLSAYAVNQVIYPINFPWKNVAFSGLIVVGLLAAASIHPNGKTLWFRLLILIIYFIVILTFAYLSKRKKIAPTG